MSKQQMTEMLKSTLKGVVRATVAVQPAYGYEITARLREQEFADIVDGTVYALLIRVEQRGFVDVEKVPSEKGEFNRSTQRQRLCSSLLLTPTGGSVGAWC